MTREEIVNSMSLQDAIQVLKDTNCYGTMDIAKSVILKALEQEHCEDVISREKAKQFLYERIDRLDDDELYDTFSVIIDDMYNELPSITPQQKVGKWEILACDLYMCSKCYGKYTYKSNFCSNCGCRMKGEDE